MCISDKNAGESSSFRDDVHVFMLSYIDTANVENCTCITSAYGTTHSFHIKLY